MKNDPSLYSSIFLIFFIIIANEKITTIKKVIDALSNFSLGRNIHIWQQLTELIQKHSMPIFYILASFYSAIWSVVYLVP